MQGGIAVKVLIWTVCVLVSSLVFAIFKEQGIIVGGIPAALISVGSIWLARTLCKKLDEKKGAGTNPEDEKKDE